MTALWKMSVYAMPLIVAVIILRALLINRLPKKTFLILWAVALCRLLIPITLPSPFSVYTLVNRLPEMEASTPTRNRAQNTAFLPTQEEAVGQALPLPQPEPVQAQAPSPKLIEIQTLLTILWVAGMTGSGAFFLMTHLRCRREYSAALPMDDVFVAAWLRMHPFRRTVQVRQSDKIHAPLTYGVWRPVVLLPKSLNLRDRNQLSYILAHEGTHIRHFDMLWKWVLAAMVCVHWFNPLVWAMYVLANRDIELHCDETVVRSFGETMKSAYALALIGLEEKRSKFVPLCNNFSKFAIEERIVSIMKIKKTSMIATLFSVVLIVGTTSALAFGASGSTPQTSVYERPAGSYEAPNYTKYEPFGVTYHTATDRLYYNGQLIRCFDDQYPLGDGAVAGLDHYTDGGVIDVHTVRDYTNPVRNDDGSYDPSGILTGVRTYSQAEFDARSIPEMRNPGISTAYSGTPASPEELAKEYSIYAPFGITYDKEHDLLYYGSQLISRFLDVLSSNGEEFSSGKFKGAMRSLNQNGGEISVEMLRDYSVLDADGYGKLIGVEAKPPEMPGGIMYETDIEWWTADAYEAWLAQEKIDLQQIIGEQGWTGTDGWFVWTQEKVDEAIRMYEQTLADIKRGLHVSKRVGLREDMVLAEGTAPYASEQSMGESIILSNAQESNAVDTASSVSQVTISQNAPTQGTAVSAGFSALIKLNSGETVDLGTYSSYVERYNAVKAYCELRVREKTMTQKEGDSITKQFM